MPKPMLPTLSEETPTAKGWVYEVKYDGFRALLEWSEDDVKLWSRNGNDLAKQFPEIVEVCSELTPKWKKQLPLLLDGEICILNTSYQANFPLLQQRNRMRNQSSIKKAAKERPATYMAFDLLKQKGADFTDQTYTKRRNALEKWKNRLQCVYVVDNFKDLDALKEQVLLHRAEGIVAKRTSSNYEEDKRSKHWLKIKNWRTVQGILSTYNTSNGYFQATVYKGDNLVDLGSVKHGLSTEDQQTLKTFFTRKGHKKGDHYTLEPSICVGIHCLHAHHQELREPMFSSFSLDLSPEDCTWEQVQWDLSLFPQVDYSSLNKIMWKHPGFTKRDLLIYMRQMAPYMLPFMKDKRLTVIRFPDGIHEESFYQKHVPDYAPSFVNRVENEAEPSMLCNDLKTLLWHTNQGAVEYHLPFENVKAEDPNEIVFDLDPPDQDAFPLAVHAARLLKSVFDRIELKAFIKTSGGKGMQVHVPIKEGSLTYDQTRRFTEKVAHLLVQQEPERFTTERLKKNRGHRLYVDYVQHAEGKTIIAPYSPRGRENATIATPLYWAELSDDLDPTAFHLGTVLERVERLGCPFQEYEKVRETQDLELLMQLIEE